MVDVTKCAQSGLKTVVKLSTTDTVLFHRLRQAKRTPPFSFCIHLLRKCPHACMHSFTKKFGGSLRFNMGEK